MSASGAGRDGAGGGGGFITRSSKTRPRWLRRRRGGGESQAGVWLRIPDRAGLLGA